MPLQPRSWIGAFLYLASRLAFDAGTVLFPVSYIFGDVLTEVYGYRGSRRVIWTGFVCALIMSATLWLVGKLPGESQWQANVGQAQYDAILGGVSSGAIVIASLVAYWGGEFSNSFVLAKMKILTKGRWLWTAHHWQYPGRRGRGHAGFCFHRHFLEGARICPSRSG